MVWAEEKWEVLRGGTSEGVNWPMLVPKTGSSWSTDYRPSQIRITFDFSGPEDVKFSLFDMGDNKIGYNYNCTSPVIISLAYSANQDIQLLDTTNIGMFITNIEFKA